MLAVAPVVGLPWGVISSSIAQQAEDDDDEADGAEQVAACDPWQKQGRAPNLPPTHPPSLRPALRHFATFQQQTSSGIHPGLSFQSTRVRLLL